MTYHQTAFGTRASRLRMALVFGILTISAPAVSEPRFFSADDLSKIVRVSDPQISPDGKTVAVIVSRANLKDDRYDGELDLIDIATQKRSVMTKGRAGISSPRWSPDGASIAFLAQDDARRVQIFVQPVGGGDMRQLTSVKTAVKQLAWRPDSGALAFAAADETPEKTGEAKFEDGFEIGDNHYLERESRMPTHLWTVSLANGASKRLTHGSWSMSVHLPPAVSEASKISWAPNGRSIVFARSETSFTGDSNSERLAIVDVVSGEIRNVASGPSPQANPMVSPDGRLVLYSDSHNNNRVNETAVNVASLESVAPPVDAARQIDRALQPIGWMPDSKAIVVTGPDGVTNGIWVQPLNGAANRLKLGDLTPSPVASVGRGGSIAFVASDASDPAELYYMARSTAKPVKLTHLQTITENMTLGRQETVEWNSDGFTVQGVVTFPPNYAPGKKLPLVLYLHGGPKSASLRTFSPQPQILAAQGWLVLEPNYRGSQGRGNDFETAIVKDAGAGPGRDVMAGVAMLEQRGLADEKRVAVSGWSYGGFMTSWLIGNYPDAWRAAVAGAPITDFVDLYTLSDGNVRERDILGTSPFVGDNLKSFVVQSPITYAWKAKTPTLIMSDVGDWRVPITQAYKLYHALKDNNVPVSFIAYPVPGHMPSDPIRTRDVWRRWTAWLAPYLNEPVAQETKH